MKGNGSTPCFPEGPQEKGKDRNRSLGGNCCLFSLQYQENIQFGTDCAPSCSLRNEYHPQWKCFPMFLGIVRSPIGTAPICQVLFAQTINSLSLTHGCCLSLAFVSNMSTTPIFSTIIVCLHQRSATSFFWNL